RGLPRERYSDEDCALIYWGIGAQLGNPVSQNARGHRLGHVRDEGRSFDDPNARAYQTNQRLDFHCDLLPVDVLGLFCLRTAKSGGASALVSALTIHNVLGAERPDLLVTAYGNFNVDWRGEEPEGEQPWYSIPMFSARDGKVSSRFCSRPYYESVTRFDDALALSDLQRETLDTVQEIANRPELRLSMSLQEGDIQLLNNHVILHSRDAFEDYEEAERKRHLLRMWIAVPEARRRPLSDALAGRYRWVEAGGIPVKPEAA
ncbi:MAG: TauD/TfdA family dioxygenase, partial [Candidatus Latescibacteria bacterium]|nr:TauD/TfdA family dioxygenase [Candidatus Latescibacterota bacterium]